MRPSAALLLLVVLAGCDRVDPTLPRAYRCDRDAGPSACPGDWHCGASGFCQDPAVLAAYTCSTDSDCEGGWHCGTSGTCYDVATAGAVTCRADGGDCAAGWRCGLEGTCHDRSTPAAYLCGTDEDCEQGWRCAPEGTCTDARAEALAPARLEPSLLVEEALVIDGGLDSVDGGPGGPPLTALGSRETGVEFLWRALDPHQDLVVPIPAGRRLFGDTLVPAGRQEACAPVKGEPGWALRCPTHYSYEGQTTLYPFELIDWLDTAELDDSPVIAAFEGGNSLTFDPTEFGVHDHAWVVPTGSGGRVLLVSLRDRLWGADVSALDPADAGSTLDGGIQSFLVPLISGTVAGFAPVAPRIAGGELSGYVLVSERVFAVDALTGELWRSAELTMPEGAPIAVWSDPGRQGRVAYADGTVLSLPSRVRISDGLAAGAQEVAQLCGDAFALAPDGLYRLQAATDGGVVGRWLTVPWPTLEARAALGGLAGGRLISTGDGLFVFTGDGEGFALSVDGGCP